MAGVMKTDDRALDAADELVFGILRVQAERTAQRMHGDANAELTPTELAALKELRRTASQIRKRREAQAEEVERGERAAGRGSAQSTREGSVERSACAPDGSAQMALRETPRADPSESALERVEMLRR